MILPSLVVDSCWNLVQKSHRAEYSQDLIAIVLKCQLLSGLLVQILFLVYIGHHWIQQVSHQDLKVLTRISVVLNMLAMSETFCEHDHCCFDFLIRRVLAFCLFSRQNWWEVSEKSQMTSQEMRKRRYRSKMRQRIFIGLLICAQTRKTSVRFILLPIFSSCLSRNHKSTLQKTCWLVRNWTTTFAYGHRGGIDREVQYVAEDSTLTVAKSRICRRRRLDDTVLSDICDILTKETSFAKLIRQYFQLFRFLSNVRFMPLDVRRPEAWENHQLDGRFVNGHMMEFRHHPQQQDHLWVSEQSSYCTNTEAQSSILKMNTASSPGIRWSHLKETARTTSLQPACFERKLQSILLPYGEFKGWRALFPKIKALEELKSALFDVKLSSGEEESPATCHVVCGHNSYNCLSPANSQAVYTSTLAMPYKNLASHHVSRIFKRFLRREASMWSVYINPQAHCRRFPGT